MRPEHIAALAPLFEEIRKLQASQPTAILEILLPLDAMPGVNRAGGHVVRHLDIPTPMVGLSMPGFAP